LLGCRAQTGTAGPISPGLKFAFHYPTRAKTLGHVLIIVDIHESALGFDHRSILHTITLLQYDTGRVCATQHQQYLVTKSANVIQAHQDSTQVLLSENSRDWPDRAKIMAEMTNQREFMLNLSAKFRGLWRLSKEQPPSTSLQTANTVKESSKNAWTWLGVNHTYM
jgi:hypothetical protein